MNTKNIFQQMNDDYLDDLTVRLSHHSTAIEGNTISLNDTATIILNDTLPTRTRISKREFYEVENHGRAVQFILDELVNNKPLDLYGVQKINELLLDRLIRHAGKFKTQENAIRGADFETAPPSQTPFLCHQWFDNTMYRLEHANSDEEKIKEILSSHIDFERIHPFQDGNGRTGRLVMFYLMLQENMYPFVITKEDKNHYLDVLSHKDISGFYELVVPCIEREKAMLAKFNYSTYDVSLDEAP
ncbi:MAG: cell filamentation protein Fic [Gammaproteobacteria bacterium]|nr:MAG: cell filamentation protein Fic [Gammaproteobacteria bacterium]